MSGETTDDQPLLAGKYRHLEALGEGAFGVVTLALDIHLEKQVAIKRLTGHGARDPSAQARFIQEARCVSRLVHPHIAMVYSLEHVDGQYYLVMEYLGGGSLAERIENGGRICTSDALAVGRDILDALVLAHSRGIVHRDVKPENVLFDDRGTPKLTDFGVARVPISMGGARVTQPGVQPGTILFMAPEQISGDQVDGRTDLYALGATLYQMLTGGNYLGLESCRSVPQAYLEIVRTRPAPIRAHLPDASPGIEALLDRLLAKDPDDRFSDASEALTSVLDLVEPETRVTLPDRTRLPTPSPEEPPEKIESYQKIFELFLADGVIVSRERKMLDDKAEEWGLSRETAGRIEMEVLNKSGLQYDQRNILEFEEMVRIFLVDGILQDEERAILIQKAEQFGLTDAVVENIIRIASAGS